VSVRGILKRRRRNKLYANSVLSKCTSIATKPAEPTPSASLLAALPDNPPRTPTSVVSIASMRLIAVHPIGACE
jgi:hypothetical protein